MYVNHFAKCIHVTTHRYRPEPLRDFFVGAYLQQTGRESRLQVETSETRNRLSDQRSKKQTRHNNQYRHVNHRQHNQ